MIRRVNGTRVTAFAVLFASLAACSPPTDAETALREWVARGEAAAEREDRRELMGMVSSSYADARGNSREDIDRTLRLLFLREDGIKVVTHIEEIEVYDDTAAKITLTTGVAGSSDTSLLGISADAVRFEYELEHDGDDWLLTGARWGELGETLR